jgi:type IV secretory pathway VirB2 component (pilin)
MVEDSTRFLADITPPKSTGQTVTPSINGPTASILAQIFHITKTLSTLKRV